MVEFYRKAAEKGDAEAMFNLGVMYAKGRGVGKDEKKAVEWYQKAADKGHAGAMFNLGVDVREGPGRGQGREEGRRIVPQGRRHGMMRPRCTTWVSCTHKGRGVGKDAKKAANGIRRPPTRDMPARCTTWAWLTRGPGRRQGREGGRKVPQGRRPG